VVSCSSSDSLSVVSLQEVRRIRNEHPDDPLAISKDRVKGSLKVTRAFGAGFLKQVSLMFDHVNFATKDKIPCVNMIIMLCNRSIKFAVG
jgi:hypothetical protein